MKVMEAGGFHLHLQNEAQFLASIHSHHRLIFEGTGHHDRTVRPLPSHNLFKFFWRLFAVSASLGWDELRGTVIG